MTGHTGLPASCLSCFDRSLLQTNMIVPALYLLLCFLKDGAYCRDDSGLGAAGSGRHGDDGR